MNENMKPIVNGIFELEPSPSLLGGYCSACGRKYFPIPITCPHCLEPVKVVRLSREGTIYSFTVIRIKPPFGLPQPYSVGYVDLKGDNLRIISLLDPEKIDKLSVGAQVALSVAPIGVDRDGQPCLRYFFTTKEEGNDI